MPMGRLRMLLCGRRMLPALVVIALTMMLRRRPVRLCSVVMMFGGLVVLVTCHVKSPCVCPEKLKPRSADRSKLALLI